MKGLTLLASYPKSGNTWLRAFLTNLIERRERPASINALLPKYFASNKILLEKVSGLEISELTRPELDRIRPMVYRFLAEKSTVANYMKIHDINYQTPGGEHLVPLDIIDKVIYLVRNPLDIVSSLAHHQNCSTDTAIDQMIDENYIMGASPFFQPKIPEFISSWAYHVTQWNSLEGIDLCTLRYEDMIERPLYSFTRVVDFLQLPFNSAAITKALELSSFDQLQIQEEQNPFSEKNPRSKYFFRKGISGSWKSELSSSQVDRIVQHFGEVMQAHGYLP